METKISWFEIPAQNFERAINFYQTVFDTKLQVSVCDEEKMACFISNNTPIGAISETKHLTPSSSGVHISLFSEKDISELLISIEKLGGNTIIPKTPIEVEGVGYFATFSDSEGNHIGLHSKI